MMMMMMIIVKMSSPNYIIFIQILLIFIQHALHFTDVDEIKLDGCMKYQPDHPIQFSTFIDHLLCDACLEWLIKFCPS